MRLRRNMFAYVFICRVGPLVAAALSAADTLGLFIQISAVEKNPNAIISLKNRCKIECWKNVTVVSQDMRYFSIYAYRRM